MRQHVHAARKETKLTQQKRKTHIWPDVAERKKIRALSGHRMIQRTIRAAHAGIYNGPNDGRQYVSSGAMGYFSTTSETIKATKNGRTQQWVANENLLLFQPDTNTALPSRTRRPRNISMDVGGEAMSRNS